MGSAMRHASTMRYPQPSATAISTNRSTRSHQSDVPRVTSSDDRKTATRTSPATTDISAAPGDTVRFKINTTASAYRLDIYRMGYYGGLGARKVATIRPTIALPQSQPACLTNATTGLIDCGQGKFLDPRLVKTAVGGVCIVAEIQKIFVGHERCDLAQHAHSAEAGVEDANREIAVLCH